MLHVHHLNFLQRQAMNQKQNSDVVKQYFSKMVLGKILLHHVFFQNGSWEYANLTGEDKGFKMNPADLTMIPLYCGVEGEEEAGLCSGTENCWAVNKKASEEDIKATLDFLKWVVTSEEGTTMMAKEFGAVFHLRCHRKQRSGLRTGPPRKYPAQDLPESEMCCG